MQLCAKQFMTSEISQGHLPMHGSFTQEAQFSPHRNSLIQMRPPDFQYNNQSSSQNTNPKSLNLTVTVIPCGREDLNQNFTAD